MQQMGSPDPLKTNVLITGYSFVCYFITFVTSDKLGSRNSLFLGSVGLAATILGTEGAIKSSPTVADLSSQTKNACAALLILWYYIYVPGVPGAGSSLARLEQVSFVNVLCSLHPCAAS